MSNQPQTRRLMETSNMFSAYRNSLKNNLNNNSNGYAEQIYPGGQNFGADHQAKNGQGHNASPQLYQTAR